MPFVKGLTAIVCFALVWGVFGGVNAVLLRVAAGLPWGVLSFTLSCAIGAAEAVGLVYLFGRYIAPVPATKENGDLGEAKQVAGAVSETGR